MTNRIENTLIAVVTALLAIVATVLIIQATAIKPLQKQIEKQNEVIIDLAKIEKYRYEISNEFGKMKPKDSQIIMDLNNKLEALTITPEDSTETVQVIDENKKGFFRRIFGR